MGLCCVLRCYCAVPLANWRRAVNPRTTVQPRSAITTDESCKASAPLRVAQGSAVSAFQRQQSVHVIVLTMPALTIHLCRLNIFTSVKSFLQELSDEPSVEIVLASRLRYTILKSQDLDQEGLAQGKRYELLLLLKTTNGGIPSNLRGHVWFEYKVNIGIPATLLSTYPARNAKLLGDQRGLVSTDLSQRTKEMLDPDLVQFMERLTRTYGDKPVTMLNLLCFHSGEKESYKRYGQAFVSVAARYGGNAKLVGSVIHGKSNGAAGPGEEPKGSKAGAWWDEISLVHYPSIKAFCNMLASDEYREINDKYRIGVRTYPVAHPVCRLTQFRRHSKTPCSYALPSSTLTAWESRLSNCNNKTSPTNAVCLPHAAKVSRQQ